MSGLDILSRISGREPIADTWQMSGAPLTEVDGTNAPASAKPAEAHPPTLIMLAINAAIRRIANTASADTLSAFIHQLKLAAFCEGG
jgi:hypothetical protein